MSAKAIMDLWKLLVLNNGWEAAGGVTENDKSAVRNRKYLDSKGREIITCTLKNDWAMDTLTTAKEIAKSSSPSALISLVRE
jgi:hypothetical protein